MKYHFFFLALLIMALTTYRFVGPQSALADDNNVNVSTSQNTVVIASSPAPQTVVMTDDRDTVKPGEILTYRIVVNNVQNNDIHQVKIVAYVPDYLVPQATSPAAAADPQTRTITWAAQTLSAKSEMTFAFKAQVSGQTPSGTVLNARAEINGPGLRASATDSTTVEGSAVAPAYQISGQAAQTVAPSPTASAVQPTAKTGPGNGIIVALASLIAGTIGSLRLLSKRLT